MQHVFSFPPAPTLRPAVSTALTLPSYALQQPFAIRPSGSVAVTGAPRPAFDPSSSLNLLRAGTSSMLSPPMTAVPFRMASTTQEGLSSLSATVSAAYAKSQQLQYIQQQLKASAGQSAANRVAPTPHIPLTPVTMAPAGLPRVTTPAPPQAPAAVFQPYFHLFTRNHVIFQLSMVDAQTGQPAAAAQSLEQIFSQANKLTAEQRSYIMAFLQKKGFAHL